MKFSDVQPSNIYLLHMDVMNPTYQWILAKISDVTDTSFVLEKGYAVVFAEDGSSFRPVPMNPFADEEMEVHFDKIFNIVSANETFQDAFRQVDSGITVEKSKIIQPDFSPKKKKS